MSSQTTIAVRRINGALGARVTGVSLATLDDATFAVIRNAFLEHHVLVFPQQQLQPEAHLAFARRFGTLNMTNGTENLKDDKEVVVPLSGYSNVLRVRNVGKDLAITENWHTDNCHVARPTAVSILAAQELPPAGGDTMFANQCAAYDTLSPVMQRMLRGLRMKHSGASNPAYLKIADENAIPHAWHPVVRTHPESGRRILFIGGRPSPARGTYAGLSARESLALQTLLFEHSVQPHNVYRHVWQDGDVVMWDNRCTMHYAVHDYGSAPRNMNRVTIEGEAPFEAPYDDTVEQPALLEARA